MCYSNACKSSKTIWFVTEGGALSSLSVDNRSMFRTDLLVDSLIIVIAVPFNRCSLMLFSRMNSKRSSWKERGTDWLCHMEGGILGLCGNDGDVLGKDCSPLMWIRDSIFRPDADATSLVSLLRNSEVVLDPCEMSMKTSMQGNA